MKNIILETSGYGVMIIAILFHFLFFKKPEKYFIESIITTFFWFFVNGLCNQVIYERYLYKLLYPVIMIIVMILSIMTYDLFINAKYKGLYLYPVLVNYVVYLYYFGYLFVKHSYVNELTYTEISSIVKKFNNKIHIVWKLLLFFIVCGIFFYIVFREYKCKDTILILTVLGSANSLLLCHVLFKDYDNLVILCYISSFISLAVFIIFMNNLKCYDVDSLIACLLPNFVAVVTFFLTGIMGLISIIPVFVISGYLLMKFLYELIICTLFYDSFWLEQ